MNELARIVHQLVSGKEASKRSLANLSPAERTALEDLRFLFKLEPSERAACLGKAGTAVDWYTPPQQADNPAHS